MRQSKLSDKKYTVEEIDQMRGSLRILIGYFDERAIKRVEDELRTYMLNGTRPQELERRAMEKKLERIERKAAYQATLAAREAARPQPVYLVPVECDCARSKLWWWNR
jgi:hypothetical protein